MRISSAQQIPARVQACAVEHQLGMPRILYETGKASRLHMLLGPGALVAGCAIVGGYNFLYNDVFSWWPTWQALLVLLVGVAWLMVGIWIILTPLVSPRVHVYLCPNGLIYSRRRLAVIRWNAITRLWKYVTITKKNAISYAYTIQRDDGAQFVLKKELPYVERLGGFLEREVARQLLPHAIANYVKGVAQDYGAITVTRTGIEVRQERRVLPWSEVEGINVDKATVSILRKGDSWDWTTLSIARVPNVSVLKGLVEHVMQRTFVSRVPEITAYEAGFSVFFGKLGINKAGISLNNGEEMLPWGEVASVGVGESEVMIRRKGPLGQWYTFPIWMISDAPALKELVDYVMSRQ